MYSRIGAPAYKKDLSRTLLLCQLLNHPENKLNCIHIAGTNGKGSVTHMISSVLIAQGYKVGIYTSPHYKDFRERIKINTDYISKYYIKEFILKYQRQIEEIEPSFFELTVAIAFDYFCIQKVDYAVIETGLGGRLDSTNVIRPLLSVITNISWDHMDLLGDTLEKIAEEKAGIIKNGVPIIIGRTQLETKCIFESKAQFCNSQIYFADKKYPSSTSNEELNIHHEIKFNPDLLGPYQEENYRTAFASLKELTKLGVELKKESFKTGFENVSRLAGLIGRWQWKEGKEKILLESAHNEDGLNFLFRWLKKQNFNQVHIVCGFVKDKSLDKVLRLFPLNAKYYFTQAKIPRALDCKNLRNQAQEFQLNGNSYKSVKRALSTAKRNYLKDDLIIVCGSIFVVAEVL